MTAKKRQIGSITEKSPGVWQVRVEAGRTRDGRRRTKARTVHGTEMDAERELDRLIYDFSNSVSIGEHGTLSDYFYGAFLPGRQQEVTKATWKMYETVYRCHIEDELGGMEIGSIDNFTVSRWIKGLPPQSAPNYTRVLRAILNQAHFDHVIDESPMEGYRFKMPKGRDSSPKPVWGAGEVAEALSRPAFIRCRLFALWTVMCGGGLSRSEALAIEWRDIRWADSPGMDGATHWTAYVSVHAAITSVDGRKGPKNGRRYRVVPIPSAFADRLREVMGKGPICQSVRHGKDGGIPTGRCITPDRVPRMWKRLFDEGQPLEGLPFVWLNRMRATYATLMQGAGIDYSLINAMQGRSENSEVLYGNYLNPQNDAFRKAADVMGGKVSGA